jgi:hypothetical protein
MNGEGEDVLDFKQPIGIRLQTTHKNVTHIFPPDNKKIGLLVLYAINVVYHVSLY